ncbi:hypothetical protein ON010_g10477 [Phytophthora cinnamomi]|nr:hypothetical protein ON010_g10477 [Phytophthora cinnamomi]
MSAAMNSGVRLILPNGPTMVHGLLSSNAVTYLDPGSVLTFRNNDQPDGEPYPASSQGISVLSQATEADEATLTESDNLTQATASRKSGPQQLFKRESSGSFIIIVALSAHSKDEESTGRAEPASVSRTRSFASTQRAALMNDLYARAEERIVAALAVFDIRTLRPDTNLYAKPSQGATQQGWVALTTALQRNSAAYIVSLLSLSLTTLF